MLLTCSQMRAVEESAFHDGITAETLMEEAGLRIAEAVAHFFPTPGVCMVVFGKGHNGGDGLVAARHLQRAGWHIDLRPVFPCDDWAELTLRQFERLPGPSTDNTNALRYRGRSIVLDGVLGIGASGPLRDPIADACREINRLRTAHAHVFALDIPTGLNGDTGGVDENAVVADTTLTIGFPKAGLVADSALNHVGRIAVLPLAELTARAPTAAAAAADSATLATPSMLSHLLKPRRFETHKGQCGRVGIVAGSRGFVGASILCADGAVRGGAGLVTLYVPEDIYPIVAARVAAEVMVRSVSTLTDVLDENLDVIAIGPGIGKSCGPEVLAILEQSPLPVVIDADALNILAGTISLLDRCAGPRLLTPHPGEMARLDPEAGLRSRAATTEAFTSRFPHTLLLKGARTIVGQRGMRISYNTTGHPGLATGGVGDVMTGLLAALAAQGLPLYDAARLGSWLIGRAAEIAIFCHSESAETLRPTVVLNHLGGAFGDLRMNSVC